MLNDYFWIELNDIDLENMWFQQNGVIYCIQIEISDLFIEEKKW